MARLVTVVARRRVGTLVAVFSDMPLTVTPVASVSAILAVTGKMPETVALVALLTAPRGTAIATGTTVTATTTTAAATALVTLTGKVARSLAFVANVRTHLVLICH